MKTCKDLMISLRQRGVTLWTEGGQLHFSAPKGSLNDEDLRNLRGQKREVIESLEEAELLRGVSAQAPPPEGALHLTSLQMRKWKYADEMNAGLGLRTCIVAHRVSGHLNTAALNKGLQALVRRHDALRMRFAVLEGTPKQWVDPDLQHSLQVIDLSDSAAGDTETALMQACRLALGEKMNMYADPMVSTKLFRSTPTDHVLLVAMNHMISDAVSCEIIAEELWALHNRIVQGKVVELPNTPAQFSHYVAWQHRTYGAWLRKHGPYWNETLQGVPRSRFSAHDRVQPPMTRAQPVIFDEGLTSRLRSVAQRECSLLGLVLLTACIAALSRWLKQSDLVVACVSNCRDHPESQRMVGFLADYLHLRAQVKDDDTFTGLLARITAHFRAAYEHRDYGRVPDLIPACMSDVVFNWVPRTPPSEFPCSPASDKGAVNVEPFPIPLTVPMEPPMKLAPAFEETSTQISGALFYRPDVFSSLAITALAGELCELVEHASRYPNVRLW